VQAQEYCFPLRFSVDGVFDNTYATEGYFYTIHGSLKAWFDLGDGKAREDIVQHWLENGQYTFFNESNSYDLKNQLRHYRSNNRCVTFEEPLGVNLCFNVTGTPSKQILGGELELVNYVDDLLGEFEKTWQSASQTPGSSPVPVQSTQTIFFSGTYPQFSTNRADYVNWSTDPIDPKLFFTCDDEPKDEGVPFSPGRRALPYASLIHRFAILKKN